ncbi:MAG TPA: sialidase family protein, partial [Thermoanaerobaculia bacterium]|nr:sialidase family protein [Thermoanaerobaculia bacterium]
MRPAAGQALSWQKYVASALGLLGLCLAAHAQPIDSRRGADSRVDYAALTRLGPWDDRNYKLTKEDLDLLAPNEAELLEPIPVFFRVALRKAHPDLPKSGPAQYPLSALQIFLQTYGGYMVDGKLSTRVEYREGRFVVLEAQEPAAEPAPEKALSGQVRIAGGAESAIKISPTDANWVIAGTNGGAMYRSIDGGASWTPAAPLPLGGACCDPTVDWSADGVQAYTATLGGCTELSLCGVWVYRSADGGATWTDFQNQTPGDPRREITTSGSDKEYLHVDRHGTSPFRDHVYLTWHDRFVMQLARSTDRGNTWSPPLPLSSGDPEKGIGSDIATDKNGHVYYFWPAFNSRRILVRKSTNGGASFGPTVQVGSTRGAYYFPIPADQTAFIYVAADADLTGGPFANRIYVAWADSTATPTTTPASNHARVQVAFSSDGGATWSVRTPHETADAGAVDRFQPWLAVGQDGVVYLTFYDTRLASGRTGVDLFSSRSTDGGSTWSAPARLTTATSPHVESSFEWGDYNGLDALSRQLLGIFTD